MTMKALPHGYSHDTRGDGVTVVKRYRGPRAAERHATERAALLRLAGGPVPVPPVLDSPPDVLVTGHLPGVHGQDLIQAGHTAEVLHSCGRALRLIPAPLVHGDYGPNNTLYDPRTYAVTAVLDWEFSHDGDPVEDLAWAEWIVRMHHPDQTPALDALFDGYGDRPPWHVRRGFMLAKCHSMLELPRLDATGVERWRQFLKITAEWPADPA